MISIGVFALLSVAIFWVSRRSLLDPTAHGFYRFFAFEAILALLVLNVPHWFAHPFGVRQLVSWFLLSVSVIFAAWGYELLRRLGDFRPSAEASAAFEWEKTDRLVTSGIYGYIRHPMYSSLLFLTWGAVLKSLTVSTLILGVGASLALMATGYMQRTRRFVPFLL
jgi:protein-S-isoprenylcysteine O-methyltransferase Ste14